MKTKKLLLAVAMGSTLLSCSTNTEQKKSDEKEKNKIENNTITAKEDSIQKSTERQLAILRQDSIDALKIKGYTVKKISGKHKYGGTTKVQYQSLTQLIAEAKKESKKDMWSNEKLQSTIKTYKSSCIGGSIRLDIERGTIGAANTEFFTIIIKDKFEKELHRVDLESDIPETPISNDYWWNIHTEWIPKKVKTPFYVYIVDRLEDAPFKFEVTAIRK